MIRNYDGHHSDVVLITLNEMEIGVRTLSSFLKGKGYSVIVGFFNDWKENDQRELTNILQWVGEINPRVIGISSVEFSRAKAGTLIAALRKEGRVVIVGGTDITLNPEQYLTYADYAVLGEGEYALAEFLEAELKGIDNRSILNLCYKDANGTIVKNEMRPVITDLDLLPHEDVLDIQHHFELRDGQVRQRQGFIMDLDYDKFKGRGLFLVTMRGCIFDCDFCSNHKINSGEKKIRIRSAASIVARIEQLKQADPSLSILFFFDDDFFLRTIDEIKTFSAAWKSRVDLPFYIYGSPVTVQEEKLRELVDAGLIVVNMGVQSGSQRVNFDVYNRKMENRATIDAGTLLIKCAGRGRFGFLAPVYDFIINSPYDAQQDLLDTIRLFRQLPKPYFTFMHSMVLFQGTRLYEQALRDRVISAPDTSAKYHFHDTLRHFDNLVRRKGNYYLNSLLYWMNGRHTVHRYGVVPAKLLGFLTGEATIRFFNENPGLISFLNFVLPTHKRVFNVGLKVKNSMAKCFIALGGTPVAGK